MSDITAPFTVNDADEAALEREIEAALGIFPESAPADVPGSDEQPAPPPAPEPPAPTDDEPPAWARELHSTVQSLERRQIYQQAQPPQFEQPQPRQQPQQPDRQPSRMLTDLDADEFGKRMEQLERYQQSMIAGFQTQEAKAFEQAEQMLRQKYPDFDEVVSQEQRQLALRSAIQAGRFGNDWTTNMSNAYKLFAFDKHFAQKDEVANKREQKKDEQRKQATQIPPAGASYQAPAVKLETGRRGYRDADRAFLDGLRAGI